MTIRLKTSILVGFLTIAIVTDMLGISAYASTLEDELQKLKQAASPTTIEELNLPEIPDGENGALVYREIFELKDSLNEKYFWGDHARHQRDRRYEEEVNLNG